MPTVNDVLAAFRSDLVAAGYVRRAGDAAAVWSLLPAGNRPPMLVEPSDGPPAPGELEGAANDTELVVSLMHSGDLAEGPYDGAVQRRTVVDVHYRTSSAAALRRAATLDAAIRGRLLSPARNYGFGFDLGDVAAGDPTVRVLEAAVWGGLGPVSRSRATGYHHLAKYLIAVAP